MTMCVTLFLWAKLRMSSAVRRPSAGMVMASPSRRSARRRAWAMRSRCSSVSCWLRHVSMHSAVQGAQAVGEPFGIAHEPAGAWVLVDEDDNSIPGGPWTGYCPRAHMFKQLFVDTLGCASQGQLTQRREIGRREIVFQRPLCLLGDVDLAFF